jgi:hypothetical protein
MGEKRNLYRDFLGESEGREPFGRPRHGRQYNIKTDLKEIG